MILKINKFVDQLPNDKRFQISPYTDDLQTSYRHPDWRIVEMMLQDSIDFVEKFAQKNGFKFSNSQNIYVILCGAVEPASDRISTRKH